MDILLVVGILLGLIIEIMRHGLELIGSCYLRIGKNNFQMYVSWRLLTRILSDHFQLMLDCGVGSRGRSCFKYENMWLKLEGFVEHVKTWWVLNSYQDSPRYVLVQNSNIEIRFEEVE
jgi:hypothetical protein